MIKHYWCNELNPKSWIDVKSGVLRFDGLASADAQLINCRLIIKRADGTKDRPPADLLCRPTHLKAPTRAQEVSLNETVEFKDHQCLQKRRKQKIR